MPSVESSRVKNTGRGEVGYSTSNASANSVTATAAVSTSSIGTISSVNGENIGTGFGLFAGTNGQPDVLLDFKTIRAGNGIVMTEDGLTITINSTASGNGGGGGGGSNGNTIADGFQLSLGNAVAAGDGPWTGAVTLTDSTAVSDAVFKLNQLVSRLLPSAPPNFPNGALSITNTAGNSPLLAVGVADHATSGLIPGAAVTRVVSGATTNVLTTVGPGDTGTLQVLINNSVSSTHTLTGTGDNGTYGSLVISNQGPFPVNQPGFWKSINVGAVGASVPLGINKIKLNHTAASATNEITFVYDDVTSTPNLTATTLAQASQGTLAYSSGVPHYGTGGTLLLGGSINNLAGQTYYGGNDPLLVQGTASITSPQTFTYQGMGITTPIHAETTVATAISPIVVNIDGQTHGQGLIQGTVKNVNGSGAPTTFANTIILVKQGTVPSNKIDELNVPVNNLGFTPNNNNAVRVLISSANDRPAGLASSWDTTVALPSYEASVVAGLLSNDTTNYSIGYLPVGPNYSSGRNNPQYVTFSFNRTAVSTFKINISGTYAGCWIKLPGVSDNSTISPNAQNGWWNAGLPYNGAGVPGNPSDASAGCASGQIMAGASGTYTITFGPQTSSNSSGNTILVRLRLNTGQSISSLSFSN